MKNLSLFYLLADLALAILVLAAAKAQEIEEIIVEGAQPAQFMPMGMGMGGMNRMNPMMYSRNQFPVDYSE